MKRKTFKDELYFVTLSIVDWVDIFTRKKYKNFIIENLQYCQKNKELEIYSYIIMPNHLHLIAKCKNHALNEVLRDFKTFTSKELYKMINDNPKESRKKWMLEIFRKHGKNNQLNKNHQIWQNGNYPTVLFSNNLIKQKIDYIHKNPVKEGFVSEPYEYYYSSANDSGPLKVLDI